MLYAQAKEGKHTHIAGQDPLPLPDHMEQFPFMPSELITKQDVHMFCPNGVAELEDHLRIAEAYDTLELLRHHLRTRCRAKTCSVSQDTFLRVHI